MSTAAAPAQAAPRTTPWPLDDAERVTAAATFATGLADSNQPLRPTRWITARQLRPWATDPKRLDSVSGYATVVEILCAALQDGAYLKMLNGFDEQGNKKHRDFFGMSLLQPLLGHESQFLNQIAKAPKRLTRAQIPNADVVRQRTIRGYKLVGIRRKLDARDARTGYSQRAQQISRAQRPDPCRVVAGGNK